MLPKILSTKTRYANKLTKGGQLINYLMRKGMLTFPQPWKVKHKSSNIATNNISGGWVVRAVDLQSSKTAILLETWFEYRSGHKLFASGITGCKKISDVKSKEIVEVWENHSTIFWAQIWEEHLKCVNQKTLKVEGGVLTTHRNGLIYVVSVC